MEKCRLGKRHSILSQILTAVLMRSASNLNFAVMRSEDGSCGLQQKRQLKIDWTLPESSYFFSFNAKSTF
jgi:hypothetical protein